jgi:phosphatidylglycerol:prolipoprotein diacylglycerol transferase
MWPTITQVQTAMGPLPVNTYGLFIMLAFSGAFAFVHFRAREQGIDPDKMIGAYLSAAVFGMLGGRLLYAFSVDLDRTLSEPWSLFSCAGFAVYGGLIGGTLGVGAYAMFMNIPPWKLADLAGISVQIGQGIGRMACFFAGCCHGVVAPTPEHPVGLLPEFLAKGHGQLWLSSTFPFVTNEVHGGVGRFHDVPLYPTQLWSVLYHLSLAGFLTWLWPRRKFDGQIAALMLMIEPPFRALVEAFRSDERGYWVTWKVSDAVAAWMPTGMLEAGKTMDGHTMGVTTSQGFAVLFVALGAAIYLVRRKQGVADVKPVDRLGEADLLEELA